MEDVVDGAGVEVGGGGGAALCGEGEVGMEGFDGAGGAISGGAAEFDEIVGGGDGDEEAAVGLEDAVELRGVATGGDGENEREGFVGVGDLAIGVGEDPFAVGIAAGGGEDSRGRDVDAVAAAAGEFDEAAEIEAVAAAGVEDLVGGGGVSEFADGLEEGRGDAAVVEAAAGVDGGGGVAGFAGAAVLRLEEGEMAVAADIEGVLLGAVVGAAGPGEGLATAPDSTDEHRP